MVAGNDQFYRHFRRFRSGRNDVEGARTRGSALADPQEKKPYLTSRLQYAYHFTNRDLHEIPSSLK
jgi:hypothetical protein